MPLRTAAFLSGHQCATLALLAGDEARAAELAYALLPIWLPSGGRLLYGVTRAEACDPRPHREVTETLSSEP